MMGRAETNSFIEYLDAKRAIDDRSLNRHVLTALHGGLQTASAGQRMKVLELGTGIGTMITRLLDWELLLSADYTALDIDPDLIQEARRRLGRYALKHSLMPGCGLARQILLRSNDVDVRVDFAVSDALEFCQREGSQEAYDLLIAHAFLDLLDLPSAIPDLLAAVKPSGMLYFTLVFDGITHFEPPLDPQLDALIEELYHRTMDTRIVDGAPSGDRHSGRHLFGELIKNGVEIVAAGASDWVVHPEAGTYTGDDALFLRHILATIESALSTQGELDPDRFAQWLQKRREQIEAGELIYVAHQIDVLGQRFPSDA
jgi:SAM-dependent methyltransferase